MARVAENNTGNGRRRWRPPFRLPARVYPIIDPAGNPTRSHYDLAAAVLRAGAPLLQLRAKHMATRPLVELVIAVQRLARERGARVIVNDRADVALAADTAGVHLGQDDIRPVDARELLGPERIIGWSTHSLQQVRAAQQMGLLDYIGFGPILPTVNKENPEPVQGLAGLRRVRAETTLPIVAIGGITPDKARSVLEAGADAVAMIGALANAADPAAVVRVLLDA